MPEEIRIEVNGRKLRVAAGTSVAATLFQAGEFRFRGSVAGEPRAALCGMGICFECRVTIDGRPHSRSCQIAARDGMVIRTS
jgi:predicted molibdopterin-dependent oxidoreductase YjgC